MLIKDENGVEKEVFSQEEIDAKLKEQEDQFNKKIDDVKTEYDTKIKEKEDILSKAEQEKKELEAKIGGVKEDHPNFKVLKEALEKKDSEIQKLNDKFSNIDNDYRKGIISKLAQNDEDLKKKIELNYNETLKGMPADTREQVDIRLEAAFKLSSDNAGPGVFDTIIGGGSKGFDNKNDTSSVEFNNNEKSLGVKLGLSEEDYKKYGPKLTIKK